MTGVLDRPALSCPPRFATPRNLDRPTLGPAVGKVARLLGKPLMPWQQFVADVLGEVDPSTGCLWYDEGNLWVPRQSGKTTLKLAKATHRCSATKFYGPRQHVVYTAQTRKDARKKFMEEFGPDLEASPLSNRIRTHWGNGDEHIRFQNRSWFGIEATTEKAGHGGVLDEAYIDEAFAHQDARLEQAFEPAMVTRANKLLLVVSTMGWLDASPYLNEKVDTGRGYIESGEPGRLAYFEWSAPDDADPGDEATWWACMPALGHTITVEAIRSAYEKAVRGGNLNGFRRAYLNQRVSKNAAEDAVIDIEAFNALVDVPADRPSPVALSVVVSEDRRWTTIGLAGIRKDGRRHMQVVEAKRGSAWAPARLEELAAKWKPTGIAVMSSSPAASLIPALEAKRLKVVKVGVTESAAACGAIVDAVEEATVTHAGNPLVAVAIGAADKQKSGELWKWKQRGDIDISPLWSLTLALHALSKRKQRTQSDKPRRAVVM